MSLTPSHPLYQTKLLFMVEMGNEDVSDLLDIHYIQTQILFMVELGYEDVSDLLDIHYIQTKLQFMVELENEDVSDLLDIHYIQTKLLFMVELGNEDVSELSVPSNYNLENAENLFFTGYQVENHYILALCKETALLKIMNLKA